MKITMGLFDRMVLQRQGKRGCDAPFAGVCAGAGRIWARVECRGRVVPGFGRRPAGRAAQGVFHGRLRGLPAGGPYDIRLAVEPQGEKAGPAPLWIRDVLVGDVWILAGQSNMQGCGLIRHAAGPDNRVRAFTMDDRWAPAKDPIHNLGAAVDRVHLDLMGGQRPPRDPRPKLGTGPGVAFGQEMARRTGVPQGLIACAHGGTSMEQWKPSGGKADGRSLYGALLRRVRKNGGRVAGLVWYQGCSDAFPGVAPLYTKRMQALVRALRRDLGDARLPVAAVQIAGVYFPDWDPASWNSVQDQQRRLPEAIRRLVLVPAIDLEFEDGIHLSGRSQQLLGRRLAQAMAALRGDRRAGPRPIALRSAAIVGTRIKVTFDRVVGGLRAAGKPAGFALLNPKPIPGIYRIDLRGRAAWLSTTQTPGSLAAFSLAYGHGLNPHCNITDLADRSLPVFGPLPLGAPRVRSEFVTCWRVSRALPSAGNLHGLDYPRNLNRLGFVSRAFPGNFADLHGDLFHCAPEDRLVFFSAEIDCPERMDLEVGLGYDGPVKVWIDGRPRFHDPNGRNPARVDKARIPFSAAAGRHEILVALGSNGGRAWGLYLRFLRRARRGQDLGRLALPKVIG